MERGDKSRKDRSNKPQKTSKQNSRELWNFVKTAKANRDPLTIVKRLRMSEALASDLEAYCQRHDLSESAVLRRALHRILCDQPELDPAILKELRAAMISLGAIGRNLNMAVRALQGLRTTDVNIATIEAVGRQVFDLHSAIGGVLDQHRESHVRTRRRPKRGGGA